MSEWLIAATQFTAMFIGLPWINSWISDRETAIVAAFAFGFTVRSVGQLMRKSRTSNECATP